MIFLDSRAGRGRNRPLPFRLARVRPQGCDGVLTVFEGLFAEARAGVGDDRERVVGERERAPRQERALLRLGAPDLGPRLRDVAGLARVGQRPQELGGVNRRCISVPIGAISR